MKNNKIVDMYDSSYFPCAMLVTDCCILSYNTLSATSPTGLHYHKNYELEFLMEGAVETYINENKYMCTAGAYWLVRPTDIHRSRVASEKTAKLISIKFTEPAVLGELVPRLQQSSFCHVGHLSDKQFALVSDEIDRLFVKLPEFSTELAGQMLVKSVLSQLLAVITLCRQVPEAETGGCRTTALYESVRYVTEHFTERLMRGDVAAKFGFSPTYYSILFKKYTGKSFSDFVLDERLKFAYWLISSTRLSISEIAENSGFQALPYFSRSFKRAFKKSPAQLRRELHG